MTRGFYLPFGTQPDPRVSAQLQGLVRRLLEHPIPGVSDLVPGYVSLYVEYDPRRVSEQAVQRWLAPQLEGREQEEAERHVEIGVCYDGQDLEDVAAQTGLSVADVIARHSGSYHVYAVGFTPGFPFMGEVDPALRLPRRTAPRARVPAHSVAIAGAQTGIYPLASPGGWHLLGRALEQVYDPHRERPFLLEPGDSVSFTPRQGEVPTEPAGLELLPNPPQWPRLRVLTPGLLDLVVDEGRFLAGRFGLSRSGPADPVAARSANALVGNPSGAALLEINLAGPTLEALTDSVVAFAGWGVVPVVAKEQVPPYTSFVLRRGEVLRFAPVSRGSRGYLALAGGLDSGRFWGSASVDLKGRIGRPLRAGDVLGTAAQRRVRPGRVFRPYYPLEGALRLRPGPQASREALAALLRTPFTVTRADRMGVQLSGPAVPGGEVLSEAVPLGAVQVTTGGQPIVLLNDRGALGGYAKPALVHPADLPRVAQLRPGEGVRFTLET